MTEYDHRIAAVLDRLVPRLDGEPHGWALLLRDAGVEQPKRLVSRLGLGARRQRRRMVVVAAAVAMIVVIAVPALAVNQGWWFLSQGAPRPQSDVNVVTSGRAAGIDWTLTAYTSEDKEVCVAFTPDVRHATAGTMGCGTEVRGERRGHHWVAFASFSLGQDDFPDFVFGPVAKGVDRVVLTLNGGQTLRMAPIEGPNNLPVDFYVVPLPRDALLHSVIARDRSGNVLEERVCEICEHPPWRTSTGS